MGQFQTSLVNIVGTNQGKEALTCRAQEQCWALLALQPHMQVRPGVALGTGSEQLAREILITNLTGCSGWWLELEAGDKVLRLRQYRAGTVSWLLPCSLETLSSSSYLSSKTLSCLGHISPCGPGSRAASRLELHEGTAR